MSTASATELVDQINEAASGVELSGERAVVRETLAKHRTLLRYTVRELSDDDARRRATTSALTLAGLLKHVIDVEEGWVDFILTGVVAGAENWETWTADDGAGDEMRDDFTLGPDDTVASLLARYTEVAARTDELVATVDLDLSHRLPPAPWFPGEAHWSARHVFAHIIGETAQHSGHADIIRESLDGQKSMG
ncbi:DinB family protein [Pseudonocardia sp. KRD291]|uniref:DinB family protein n=1 Tax=Pseudonocardia sp. KRD291 TaxID=2792007 RepID=UPI001C4A20B5|nr:DinB family protein [Pseudonocardia sp. KRD291]MBW0105035.1 DinB family protein [Pseudonocardia sp. KRD291]